MLEAINFLRWQDIVDILLIYFIIYRTILIIRGTRAVQMLAGIVILVVVYFVSRELELLTLNWLLRTLSSSIFLIIIIVFQSDIRRALTQVGKTPFYKTHDAAILTLDIVVAAAYHLARRRIGALIVIERETGLMDYIESGHKVDAILTKELLVSLFHPSSPLHDGGVVIDNGRISTAGCILPLSRNPYLSKSHGTRHRAAVGLSEETDAVIVVVSEETQKVSIVQHGSIKAVLNEASLKKHLEELFVPKDTQPQKWQSWFNRP